MSHRPTLLLVLAAIALSSCRAAPATTPAAPGAAPAAAQTPTRAAVAPADARRASGGGFVYQGEDRLQFSFIVKNTGLPGGISSSGTLGGRKFAMQGMAAEVGFADGRVTFSGATSFDGKPARYTVEATDDPAGDAMSLRIAVEGGDDLAIAGPLRSGNLEIKPDVP